MRDNGDLTNHFLIAMPALADPNFSHTITYICEHNNDGAMGIVINRPLDISLGEVLEQMQIQASPKVDTSVPVFMGGPVQPEHGFVLHFPPGVWDASLLVTDEITVTTSQDILAAIAHGEGPNKYLITLGYAGWGAGQLEQEMADNTWLSAPIDPDILFDLPVAERWAAAAARLGVDLNLISSDVGHA